MYIVLLTSVQYFDDITNLFFFNIESNFSGVLQRNIFVHLGNTKQFIWTQVDGHSGTDKDLCRFAYYVAYL